MPGMRQRLFTILSALSLVLCIATVWLWTHSVSHVTSAEFMLSESNDARLESFDGIVVGTLSYNPAFAHLIRDVPLRVEDFASFPAMTAAARRMYKAFAVQHGHELFGFGTTEGGQECLQKALRVPLAASLPL
jgi:hypothetical protein